MNAELRRALGHAYEVFGHYNDDLKLAQSSGVSNSLRNLTREDWNVMDTKFDMGVLLWEKDAVLLRHFLPRFLEWMSNDSTNSLESWDVSDRLNQFDWLKWPAEEVTALRAVFQAWTRELLTDPDARMPIEFLVEIKEDLTLYLDTWLETRPDELAEWLRTLNWKKHQGALNWATATEVEAKLEAEFFCHPEGERARLLSQTIDLIRSLRG